jgi:type IV secretion system protein TrbD
MAPKPEGFEAPLAQALAEPVLLAGAPRDYAVLMGTIALMLGLALRIWWLGLLWWAISHALGAHAARRDKHFFQVARRHLTLAPHLDA